MNFKHYILGSSIICIGLSSCQHINSDSLEPISLKDSPIITTLNERAPQPNASLHRPFDFPLVLSGNFGELRSNHFHSGIDFKTEGSIGKPIHCADDGYISQISVSGGGYGRALYVTHPSSGLTTVYAHIDQFVPKVDSIVKAEQYRRETFAINLKLSPNQLPVAKGEVIALSGNSGYSFGPHLHMEVRHTSSGDAIDPLPYFKAYIADQESPRAHKLALYPDKDNGRVNGSNKASYLNISTVDGHSFSAWGKVYPAIEANDYMTDSHNVYGVKFITLKVDGKDVYKRTIDRFRFQHTRAINTMVDYFDLINNDKWYQYTHIPQSKPLGVIVESTLDDGAVNINEERVYNCEFILKDEYGNSASIPFTIKGKKTDIKATNSEGKLIKYTIGDTINYCGLNLKFYNNCFYDDTHIKTTKQDNNKYYSPMYSIGNRQIPLTRSYRMAITIDNDTIKNKRQYCIARVRNNNLYALTSLYKNGQVVAYTSQFGKYTVVTDTIAPKITPINESSWGKNSNVITYRITDNLSGLNNYRGLIDGKWVMFEADNKNSLISFKLDSNYITKGKDHVVEISATDNCGNLAKLSNKFHW